MYSVAIYEDATGKRFHRKCELNAGPLHQFAKLINTVFDRSKHNPFPAEMKALEKLRSIVSEDQFAMYMLSNCIIIAGKSGMLYAVRKGLPTIAFRLSDNSDAQMVGILCTHPIGGFRRSYAGFMVPTDETIVTILLIKTDEHDLWKRSNQYTPEHLVNGLIS
jgi:hypothetical protein